MRSISPVVRDGLPHDDRVDRDARASLLRVMSEKPSGAPPPMAARTGVRFDGAKAIASGVRGPTLERNPR
jgi:hypothetical protein